MDALETPPPHCGRLTTLWCSPARGSRQKAAFRLFHDRLTGLWARHDPQRLETAKAFRENPALVWGWYLWRRQQVPQAKPNAAHLAIARLADGGRQVTVITQNIDDLHERAGSQDVVHLHESLMIPKCFACHRHTEISAAEQRMPHEGALVEPPRCTRCNGRLRPGVVCGSAKTCPQGHGKPPRSRREAAT